MSGMNKGIEGECPGLLRRGLATNFGFLFPTVAVQPYAVRGGGHAIAACACGTPRTHGTLSCGHLKHGSA